MRIQHNLPGMAAVRYTGISARKTGQSLEKLSSGFRVNKAADDAAGLAVSEKMRGQIRGLAMATMNVEHGLSLIQTAEGGCNEVHSILGRMRELAVQSSNGTYQDGDRDTLEREYQAVMEEIDRIAESTHFNGIHLLSKGVSRSPSSISPLYRVLPASPAAAPLPADPLTVVDENAPDGVRYACADWTMDGALTGSYRTAVNTLSQLFGFDYDTVFFTRINPAYKELNLIIGKEPGGTPTVSIEVDGKVIQGQYGKSTNGYNLGHPDHLYGYWFYDDLGQEIFALSQPSWVTDPGGGLNAGYQTGTIYNLKIPSMGKPEVPLWEWAMPGSHNGGESLLGDAYIYVKKEDGHPEPPDPPDPPGPPDPPPKEPEGDLILQVGANKGDTLAVHRFDIRCRYLGIEPDFLDGSSIATIDAANAALQIIDAAVREVSGVRAYFGATQNRLESIYRNLGVSGENLTAAESSIRDLDMTKEIMAFQKETLILQAAQSMSVQANQLIEGVLGVLR